LLRKGFSPTIINAYIAETKFKKTGSELKMALSNAKAKLDKDENNAELKKVFDEAFNSYKKHIHAPKP
jgi:predicted metalloprotease with PDZ domain